MLPKIWVAGINKCIFFLSKTVFPEQMMLDGSVISEVTMVLYLRFRFQEERMFLGTFNPITQLFLENSVQVKGPWC